jgi:hypothetical protein
MGLPWLQRLKGQEVLSASVWAYRIFSDETVLEMTADQAHRSPAYPRLNVFPSLFLSACAL